MLWVYKITFIVMSTEELKKKLDLSKKRKKNMDLFYWLDFYKMFWTMCICASCTCTKPALAWSSEHFLFFHLQIQSGQRWYIRVFMYVLHPVVDFRARIMDVTVLLFAVHNFVLCLYIYVSILLNNVQFRFFHYFLLPFSQNCVFH